MWPWAQPAASWCLSDPCHQGFWRYGPTLPAARGSLPPRGWPHLGRPGGGSGRVVVRDYSATILRGDKVGLLGPNGAGKTTLLKLILGELQPDPAPANAPRLSRATALGHGAPGGERDRGLLSTRCAMPQPGRHAGRLHQSRFRSGSKSAPSASTSKATWATFCSRRAGIRPCARSRGRAQPAAAGTPVCAPGQRAGAGRAHQRSGHRHPELLEDLLQSYDGTVFLVSHDRTFMDNVVTSTIAYEGDGRWREYEGGVSDWLVQSRRSTALRGS